MNNNHPPLLLTRSQGFAQRYSSGGQTPLYEVRAGVSVKDALNHAVNLVDTVREITYAIGVCEAPLSLYPITAAALLAEMAAATLEAVHERLEHAGNCDNE